MSASMCESGAPTSAPNAGSPFSSPPWHSCGDVHEKVLCASCAMFEA